MNNPKKAKKLTIGQKAAIAEAIGKTFWTIERWERVNDDRLTSDRVKKALKEYEEKTGQPA